MYKTILIWLYLLICNTAFSQVITVTDHVSGQPLEDVIIQCDSPKAFTTTNAEGKANIKAFKGAERIEIYLIGYMPVSRSYTELINSDARVNLRLDPMSLDQAVVSASRWSQPKKEVPAKITVINSQSIAFQNPQTAADLLETSGEVFIQKSQLGGGSPMIRGFSTNRLLITVDGIRMNTAIFRSGNLQNVISIDPFAVQSAEVLFGPGSVMYGSDAIGGVMSFQTLSPQLSLTKDPLISGNAATRYSSASNERTMHFDINMGWNKWASLSSLTFTDYDDLRMGRNGPDEYLRKFYVVRQDSVDVVMQNEDPLIQNPTGYSQVNLMQKFMYRPSEHWSFHYGLHYSATSEFGRYDRLIRTKNGKPRAAEWNYGPQVWMMHMFNLNHHADYQLYDHMAVRMAYQLFEESRISRDFNDLRRITQSEEVDAWSISFDFEKDLNPGHIIFYGIEGVRNDVTSSGFRENVNTGTIRDTNSRYPLSNWSSYAAYASYQWKPRENLVIQAGSRYSHFILDADFSNNLPYYPLPFSEADLDDGALTGSVGISYFPENSWTFSANASTGFRSPNVDDLGKIFDSGDQIVIFPNPELRAEYVYNLEGNITKTFSKRVKLDVTAFYSYLNNALVRRPSTLNGADSIFFTGEMSQIHSLQNAANTQIYGIQAGVLISMRSGWSLSSRFNFQKGTDQQDDGTMSPSRHAAPWFGATHLLYELPRLKLDLYSQYSGSVSYENLAFDEKGKPYLYVSDGKGNFYSPSWYTLNFKVQYKAGQKITLGAGVENITDQRYQPYSSGIVAAGRNLVFSLRSTF